MWGSRFGYTRKRKIKCCSRKDENTSKISGAEGGEWLPAEPRFLVGSMASSLWGRPGLPPTKLKPQGVQLPITSKREEESGSEFSRISRLPPGRRESVWAEVREILPNMWSWLSRAESYSRLPEQPKNMSWMVLPRQLPNWR